MKNNDNDDNGKLDINHNGHRQRMQEKITKFGLRSLQPHEVLEYLLWFTIPRKDTNPLGHKLIDTFGSVANVLDADPRYLEKIDGIGARTAQFLTSLPEVFSIYKESVSLGKLDILNDVNSCVRFFRNKFEIHKQEDFYIICLNGQNKVVKYETLKGENDVSIKIDTKHFADFINDDNVMSILVCHTHPFGQVTPSMEDLNTTKELLQICNLMRKQFFDHIIFNDTTHFSFGVNRIISYFNNTVDIKIQPDLKAKLNSKKVSTFSYLDGEVEEGLIKDFFAKKWFDNVLKLSNIMFK